MSLSEFIISYFHEYSLIPIPTLFLHSLVGMIRHYMEHQVLLDFEQLLGKQTERSLPLSFFMIMKGIFKINILSTILYCMIFVKKRGTS